MFPDEKAELKTHSVIKYTSLWLLSTGAILSLFLSLSYSLKKSFKNLGVSSSVNLAKKGNINVKIIQKYLMIHCFFFAKTITHKRARKSKHDMGIEVFNDSNYILRGTRNLSFLIYHILVFILNTTS